MPTLKSWNSTREIGLLYIYTSARSVACLPSGMKGKKKRKCQAPTPHMAPQYPNFGMFLFGFGVELMLNEAFLVTCKRTRYKWIHLSTTLGTLTSQGNVNHVFHNFVVPSVSNQWLKTLESPIMTIPICHKGGLWEIWLHNQPTRD